MSEISEDFAALRLLSQQKRASNRQSSAAILRERGVAFESRNDEAHLIVRHNGRVVDFWPGTGKWIFRGAALPRSQGRGVYNLIKELAP